VVNEAAAVTYVDRAEQNRQRGLALERQAPFDDSAV
jgi:hypothetical protein